MQSAGQIKTVREILGLPLEDDFGSDIVRPIEENENQLGQIFETEEALAPLEEVMVELGGTERDEPIAEPQQEEKLQEIQVSSPVAPSTSKRFFSKDYVRYPLIFVVSLGLFYVVFNFKAVTAQLGAIVSPPRENKEAVLGEDTAKYNKWIKKYYVHVGDKSILEPNNDADRDGLTNADEFYLKSNPLKADTDNDGKDDGTEVIAGDNPLYTGKLSYNQTQALEKMNSSREKVAQRRDFNLTQVAGRQTGSEFPVDEFHVDTTREGRVRIPKLGVDAPLVWNKNFDYVQEDLKYGVIHHPNTAYPGEKGMSSIHGHSSGYLWDGEHKYVFTKINLLEAGDEVLVTVYGTNGQERTYRYVVVSKGQAYAKEDPAQFQAADSGSYLNISTSWPIGTARERFVVTTELAGL